MPTKRDDLNGAEHENQPTHKLEDLQVYKVDLVKRPATGDAFLAVRSANGGGEPVTKKRSAMSVDQFRQKYRPVNNDAVTIAQRGDPVGEAPVERAVPDADASTEDKREAQKKRSEKYGIEALEGKGERLSYPSDFPTKESLYGDPCLSADTLVYTDRGSIPICKVVKGDTVFSLEHKAVRIPTEGKGKDKQRIRVNLIPSKVLASQKTGEKPVFCISTCEGEINATANHRFLTINIPEGRGTIEPKSLVWKRVDELEKDDLLVMGGGIPGDSDLSPDFARFLGFYMGDGYLDYNSWKNVDGIKHRKPCRIHLACADEKEAVFYSNLMSRVFDSENEPKVKPHHQNACWLAQLNCTKSAGIMLDIFKGVKANKKAVPDFIFRAPLEVQLAFLEGYIDADGHRTKHKCGSSLLPCVSSSYKLIQGVRALARYVGWGVTNIYVRAPSEIMGYMSGEAYSITLYPDRIFKNKWGGTPIFDDSSNPYVHYRRVQSIVEGRIEPVYDIQTDTGNFVADGFVVHNCNLKFPHATAENELDLGRANNARTRFKQFADTYEKEKSKKIVHTRIVEAQLKAGASPGYDENDSLDQLLPQETVDKMEQGVERESNEETGDEEMTKAMLERMDRLTATVGSLVERMTPIHPAAPEPEATPAVDPAAEAVTEPGAEPPATPVPEADPIPAPETGDESAATPAPDVAPVAPEPEATATIPILADASAPAVDTVAVERMTASLESVVTTMEGVTRGVVATGEAVSAMGGRMTTVVDSVTALTERMDSVERGMTTGNAEPVDETEGENVKRGADGKPVKKSVFRGVLFGDRGR